MKSSPCIWIVLLLHLVNAYEKHCYDDLGCFTDAPPFGDTEQRPFIRLPSHPDDINVRFYLDTRYEKNREVSNKDMIGLEATSFDGSKPTKFIVHGFLHNGDVQWMNEMSQAFISIEDFNVIRVDWVGGSRTVSYPQAATDTQIVGAEVGLFINNTIRNFGASSADVHCIGHSLGSHICGYAGNFLTTKIGRISGLDPAGSYFEDTPIEVRLDSSDADFVDVIHTNAEKPEDGGYGSNQTSGHVDFWPNNGLNQPGCDQNALSTVVGMNGIALGVQDYFACSHLRAVYFYTESITSLCPFYSKACDSYDDYIQGNCLLCPRKVCTSMGYHSIDTKDTLLQSSNPNHYLQTAAFTPYCEYAANVQVRLGSESNRVDGKLFLALYSPSENTELLQLGKRDEELSLKPRSTYSYFAQYRTFPSSLNRVKLLWTKEELTVTRKRITVAQVTVWSDLEQKQYTFCDPSESEMEDDVRHSLYLC